VVSEKTLKQANKKNGRVWQIDLLRGVCVILMIFDHTMLDFSMVTTGWAINGYSVNNAFFDKMSGIAYDYWNYFPFRKAVRFSVLFVFIFLSGISSAFSRSNPKRLCKLSGAAGAITLVTLILQAFLGDVLIVFGILYLLAFSLALYIAAELLCKRWEYMLVLGAILTAGGLMIPFFTTLNEETALSALNAGSAFRAFLGTELFGADCYGIFPYTGFFFLGAAFGKVYFKPSACLFPVLKPQIYVRAPYAPIRFVGRNGLWMYLAHQVIVPLTLISAASAVGYRFF
jgi:uncharacterized membrane protein